MAGRFAGISDLEWRLLEDIFPPAPSKRGWGLPWTSKSVTHRWRRWQAESTLAAMQVRILGIAEEQGMIRWE